MKARRNVSLAAETIEALDLQPNVSEYLDALVAYAEAFNLPPTVRDLRRAVVDRAKRAPDPEGETR